MQSLTASSTFFLIFLFPPSLHKFDKNTPLFFFFCCRLFGFVCVHTVPLCIIKTTKRSLKRSVFSFVENRGCHAFMWLAQSFQRDETGYVTGWVFFINHYTLSFIFCSGRLFSALCAAAYTCTKIAGELGDTHAVCAPKTYGFTLVIMLARLK